MITLRSIRWSVGLALLAIGTMASGGENPAPPPTATLPPPVHLTAEQDHQRLMDLLHIKSIREGADGRNPKAPNAASYDESKANPYPKLPDALLLNNGKKLTSAKVWWTKRRPEIVEDFDREIYGRVPKDTPKVSWEVISTTKETNGEVPVVTKKLVGHVDNSSYPAITVDIQLTLSTPSNANGPVPVIMEFSLSPEVMAAFAKRFPQPPGPAGPTWQQQVLARGWGYATLVATSIQADNGAGLHRRHHRPSQQRAAAQVRRLGRTTRLGLGRQPGSRLLRNRQIRGCETSGHRGPFTIRQGDPGDYGVRSAFRHRLRKFIRRGWR